MTLSPKIGDCLEFKVHSVSSLSLWERARVRGFVGPALVPNAVRPLKRMLDFAQAARLKLAGNA